jgi:hypothetical protein
MATQIRLPFFNNPMFLFNYFILFYILKPKSSCHFLMVQFFIFYFFIFLFFCYTSNQILVVGQQLKCGQVNQKIMAIKMVIQIRSSFFNNLDFFKFSFIH